MSLDVGDSLPTRWAIAQAGRRRQAPSLTLNVHARWPVPPSSPICPHLPLHYSPRPQYAHLSWLYALPGMIVGGLSGLMVDSFGYPIFFAATSTIGIPVVTLCLIVWRIEAARKASLAEPREGTWP